MMEQKGNFSACDVLSDRAVTRLAAGWTAGRYLSMEKKMKEAG